MPTIPIQDAILLAAGEGRKFWPFNEVRNKCAIPVGNVPNIRRIAEALVRHGVSRIAVVIGANAASVRHALAGLEEKVRFVEGHKGAGTAGAALLGIRALGAERFLIVSGDLCFHDDDLKSVLGAGSREAAALVDPMQVGEGSLWTGCEPKDGALASITGHESGARFRLLGLLAADRSIEPVLEANPGFLSRVPVGGMPPLEPDLAQSVADWGRPVQAILATRQVTDLDKPWHILDANRLAVEWEMEALAGDDIHPTARIDDSAEIGGPVRLGPQARIGARAVVRGGALLGENAQVVNGPIIEGPCVVGCGARVSDYSLAGSHTVIGPRCVLGHGAEISGVMLEGAYLWHYCEIYGVVGRSVDIGAATVCGTLRFDDGPAEHRVLGRRERPASGANATYFGDFSRTGVNVITMPGAKIGCYSCVGAGVVVYDDVPSRTLLLLKQETVSRPWGPERYGW